MDSMSKALSDTYLPNLLLSFIANFSMDGSILPPRFVTEFEISCLEFTPHGTTK